MGSEGLPRASDIPSDRKKTKRLRRALIRRFGDSKGDVGCAGWDTGDGWQVLTAAEWTTGFPFKTAVSD